MKLDQKEFISEEEKEVLRKDAIEREFKRLNKLVKTKGKIILTYQITFIALIITFCSFYYYNQYHRNLIPVENKSKELKTITTPKQTIAPPQKAIKKQFYTVYFLNDNEYALAQFSEQADADDFCRLFSKMELPATKVIRESIRRTKEDIPPRVFPYRYAVQLGAYHRDILKKYKNNLVWISYKQSDEFHKYQVAPFYGFSKSKEFTLKIDLQDEYILPY